jgi:hypothetical protein
MDADSAPFGGRNPRGGGEAGPGKPATTGGKPGREDANGRTGAFQAA